MCNQGFWGGNCCWIIVILILCLVCGGCGNGCGCNNGCGNNCGGCGCGGSSDPGLA